MTADDELAIVVEIACGIEDRDGAEQRAMIATALRLDADRGRFTITNPHPRRPYLVDLVLGTYRPTRGRVVAPTAQQRNRIAALRLRWRACPACGYPMGAHYAGDACPTARDLAGKYPADPCQRFASPLPSPSA